MPSAHVNGIKLYYEISGSGEPLVLIAGIGYDVWYWQRMLPGLSRHFRVIALDNRGIGRSDKPPGPYSAQLMANDSVGLLDALDIPQAHLFGHSMGCFIAQAMALDHPQRIKKLILAATNFGGPNHIPISVEALTILSDVSGDPVERFRRGLRVSVAPGFDENHPDVIAEWIAYRLANPLDPVANQAQMGVGLGLYSEEACFENKLPALKAPTLILFGDQDRVVPTANASLLARQIPDSRVQFLPDAGHHFPIEVPAAAAAAVVKFLTQNT
jgi:pimeloyl-ACP methyl ester carboxylesterase